MENKEELKKTEEKDTKKEDKTNQEKKDIDKKESNEKVNNKKVESKDKTKDSVKKEIKTEKKKSSSTPKILFISIAILLISFSIYKFLLNPKENKQTVELNNITENNKELQNITISNNSISNMTKLNQTNITNKENKPKQSSDKKNISKKQQKGISENKKVKNQKDSPKEKGKKNNINTQNVTGQKIKNKENPKKEQHEPKPKVKNENESHNQTNKNINLNEKDIIYSEPGHTKLMDLINKNFKQKVQNISLLTHDQLKCPNHTRTLYFINKYKYLPKELISNKNKSHMHIDNVTIKEKKFMISYTNTSFYTVIKNVLNDNGIYYTNEKSIANYFHISPHNQTAKNNLIKSLNKYQILNAFPYTGPIYTKENIYLHYINYTKKYPKEFDFVPETYILPKDKEILLNKIGKKYKIDKNNLWVCKAKEIFIINNFDNLPKNSIVSKYIQNPHLINNKKYNIRLFILVTDYNPLKIYLYKRPIIRLATENYTLSNYSNLFAHLTSYDINIKNKRIKNESQYHIETELIADNSDMNKIFPEKEYKKIYESIKDIVTKTILTVSNKMIGMKKNFTYENNLYELYGADFLIDDKFKPWLIDFNLGPGLFSNSKNDYRLKYSLITDIFNIIGFVPYDHIENKTMDKQHIYKNKTEKVINDSICEFSRPIGDFERIFPVNSTIKKYKRFIDNPGNENLELWKEIGKK